MKITQERLPNAQIALTVQPDEQQIEQALRKAAAKISQRYTIPGFRKGKAPYAAVVRAFGKEALYEQAAEDMGDEVYKEALKETGLQPIGPGVLEDVTFDPLTYRLVLPMPPEVDLGDYRSIRVERPVIEVSDEEVEAELVKLQEQQAEWLPVEDGAAYGDLLTMQIIGKVEDQEIVDDEAFELILEEDGEDFPPGFDAKFLGAKAGDAVAFDLDYPEDWDSDFAGSTAHFEAQILSVKRSELPPLDDDFAPLIGDYETLDDLKASIHQSIRAKRQEDANVEYANAVMQKVLEGATSIAYPPMLLDDATERLFQEQEQTVRSAGLPLKEYLRLTGQTETELRQRLRSRAEMQLRVDLALDKLVELEGLQATEAEIDEQIEKLLHRGSEEDDSLRQFLQMPSGRHALAHDIERNKAIQRLIAIGEGSAPELPAKPADSAAEPQLAEEATGPDQPMATHAEDAQDQAQTEPQGLAED